KELALLEEKVANARKEYDYNIFQLTEIDSLNPVAGEFQKLEEDFSLLSNAEAIGAVLTELVFSVYDDENSIYNRLNILRKQLSALATNPSLKELAAKMETIIAEVKDLYHEADEINGTVGSDSMSLEVLTQRLNTYNNILHKHGFKTDAELLNFSTELKEKVNRIEDFGNEIKLLTHHQKEQKDALTALAKTLTANRKKIIPTLEKELATMLKELGIPDAVVQINLLPLENFNEFGLDKAAIFFSANKGMQPAPVADAASGGELSRLMLCFKYLLADSALLPTIIFDEIDSGISGEIALRVGNMLKKLSRKHQVLAITHLPQIAAIGNQHLLVFKQTEKGSTQTSLRPLSATDRIHEIAKMIAGNNPSNINIATAKELLGE
ncbi:MAG: hypothetical protein NTX03_01955, partial [Bacteroidetes bacterium]|nr:hypothetical protein [Bacteroidota bacterium]